MDLTRDIVSDGALAIFQSKAGYRFGLDALLLATDLPEIAPDATVVDLGAGQGVVGLAIACRMPGVKVIAVEVQPSLAELLERNVVENGLEDRVEMVRGDLRDHRTLLRPHQADLVVANPPYTEAGRGRPSPNQERDAAHKELHGTLADFLAAAQYVARPGGWLRLVLPPVRTASLWSAVAGTDFRVVGARFVHARPDRDAYLVEWTMRRGSGADFTVRPPLVLYGDGDELAPEVAERLASAARPR